MEMKVKTCLTIAASVLLIGANVSAAEAATTEIAITCEETSVTIFADPGQNFSLTPSGECLSSNDWYIRQSHRDNVTRFYYVGLMYNLDGDSSSYGYQVDLSSSTASERVWRLLATNPADTVGGYLANTLVVGAVIGMIEDMGGGKIQLIYGGPGRGSTSVSPAMPSMPAVHQGLPMPASNSCKDIVDSEFAWGTGLTGGWTKSWEPWVRSAGSTEATGGWACVRTMRMRDSVWVLEASA